MRHWRYADSVPTSSQAQDFNWTRRDFLKTLSLTLAAIPFRSALSLAQTGTTPFFSRQKTDRPKKIIVIGAGLAGLTAAYELAKAGHDVVIFEARNRNAADVPHGAGGNGKHRF